MGLFFPRLLIFIFILGLRFCLFFGEGAGSNGFGLGLLYCFEFGVGSSGFGLGLLFNRVLKNKLLTWNRFVQHLNFTFLFCLKVWQNGLGPSWTTLYILCTCLQQDGILFWLRGSLRDWPDILPEFEFIKKEDNNRKSVQPLPKIIIMSFPSSL